MTGLKTLPAATPAEHLSAETLYRYLEGQLPPEASHQAERHLLDCDLCNEALEGLASVPPESTHHALFDLNRSIRNRSIRRKPQRLVSDLKNWALAAAILFLLVFSALVVWYQTRIDQPTPAASGQGAPAPLIGHQAYQEYLLKQQRPPVAAPGQQNSGRVRLSFTVNPDSTISDVVVLESPAAALQTEAIRLLRQGPKWVPAQHLGRPVRSRAYLEITFPAAGKPNI